MLFRGHSNNLASYRKESATNALSQVNDIVVLTKEESRVLVPYVITSAYLSSPRQL